MKLQLVVNAKLVDEDSKTVVEDFVIVHNIYYRDDIEHVFYILGENVKKVIEEKNL